MLLFRKEALREPRNNIVQEPSSGGDVLFQGGPQGRRQQVVGRRKQASCLDWDAAASCCLQLGTGSRKQEVDNNNNNNNNIIIYYRALGRAGNNIVQETSL